MSPKDCKIKLLEKENCVLKEELNSLSEDLSIYKEDVSRLRQQKASEGYNYRCQIAKLHSSIDCNRNTTVGLSRDTTVINEGIGFWSLITATVMVCITIYYTFGHNV